MSLPRIPAVVLGFILSGDVIVSTRSIRGALLSLWAFILKDEEKNRTKSCTQHTGAAKQLRKYVEQATASSGNPSFLGHRPAPVSSYSTSIIARTAVGRWPTVSYGFSVLAKNNVELPHVSVQPWLSGNDRKQALGTWRSAGSVKVLDDSANESLHSIHGRDRCIRQH
jgi:hypothetical protein